MVGLISFRGACSMRLSFKHSNPVVFWAIAINTSVGPWLKGCILLLEPGYFKYLFFDRIVRYGDYFVSRLKGNANSLIVCMYLHNKRWILQLKMITRNKLCKSCHGTFS